MIGVDDSVMLPLTNNATADIDFSAVVCLQLVICVCFVVDLTSSCYLNVVHNGLFKSSYLLA